MGAQAFKSLESEAGKHRQSSDVWSFGILLSELCEMKQISVSPNERDIARFEAMVAKLPRSEAVNIRYWLKTFGISKRIAVRILNTREACRKIASDFHPKFKKIVEDCTFIEGEQSNVRKSFSDLICDLEIIRRENGWGFNGNFPEDVQTFIST